jgi:hypothetical protein
MLQSVCLGERFRDDALHFPKSEHRSLPAPTGKHDMPSKRPRDTGAIGKARKTRARNIKRPRATLARCGVGLADTTIHM